MTMNQPSFKRKIEQRLQFIYKENYSESILKSLMEVVSSHNRNKTVLPKWTEEDVVLITYGDSIKKKSEMPLKTLKHFLDENLKQEITTIHILPFFPFSSDDGFSVIDFRQVNPKLGNWQHIKELQENFSLMTDLVINHASSQSEWFRNFVAQAGKGRDFFVTEQPETDLSAVIRPRSTPLLTAVETLNGTKHVWTTFSADQVDLDFSNPDLLIEMIDILLFYISKGARIIRLDAIAFLWKVAGTTCLHLPETHEVVKLMRDVAEHINPFTIILTETNVPNLENLSYFGNNDEAHMVYQFSLPPLLLHALHTGNSTYLTKWAQELPALNGAKTFFNFTASHDGIGVRPLEGLLPENEKVALINKMKDFGGRISYKSNTDGSKSPYEINITYFDALKGNNNGEDQFQQSRFLASQTVMMSLAGIPAFYIHSLLATPNHLDGVKESGHNRTINRRKWELPELEELLENESANRSIFSELKRRISIRKLQPAFHPNAQQEILNLGKPFFAIKRSCVQQSIIVIINISDKAQDFQLSENTSRFDLLTQNTRNTFLLEPYECIWLEV